jgi:hypothetical protein
LAAVSTGISVGERALSVAVDVKHRTDEILSNDGVQQLPSQPGRRSLPLRHFPPEPEQKLPFKIDLHRRRGTRR